MTGLHGPPGAGATHPPPGALSADQPTVPGGPHARGEHVHSEPRPPGVPLPRRHSVRAQVLGALREALLTGDLAPGQVYSAPALAARFGVSATPVREAMQQLAGEGAVETVPNRGFRVAEHSPRDVAELGEVQAMLEIPAVLALARTLPRESWDALRPLAELTLTAAARGDHTAFADADRAFHRGLLELTGNRQLVAVAEEVRLRGQRAVVRRPLGSPRAPLGHRASFPSELLASAAEHVELLDALAERDLVTAERVARAHLTPG
ncbi:GntR family transcriptional regulator [Streptomyces sp. AJS327]|uniref:GntR family transcriptional regulator n=1 Tax=Streptomyces sp. AJS327 TaxID=2545265 RepID=UPI00215517C9|nr:GntR family transcriptional regulator [Streptomyces sp. AJS327]